MGDRMAADLNITGEVVVSADKAEAAFNRVGAKADAMAKGVAASADKAGKAVDGIGAGAEKGAQKFTRAEAQIRADIEKSTRALENLGKTASQRLELKIDTKGLDRAKFEPFLNDLRKMEQATQQAEARLGGLSNAAALAGRAFAVIGIGASVGQFISAADAVTTLNNQLKLATGSVGAASVAYASLYEIAQRSRVSFVELGSTYASIARATGELGISQQRMLKVTESIGNAMTISGGSAQGMQAALVQLSQGMASGVLRGEELNSVMEQAPRLAKALADGLGVPIGKLREMGAAGQITAEQVVKALESQSEVLRGEVAGAALTVGQAFVTLSNASTNAIGEFDKATGTSGTLAKAISSVASSMDTMGKAFKDNEATVKTVMGALAGAAALSTLAAIPRAITAVGAAVSGLSVILAANPAVLALLGVGAAVGGGIAAVNAYKKTADGIASTIDVLEKENARAQKALDWSANMGPRYQGGDDATRRKIDERTEAIKKLRQEQALLSGEKLDTRAEDARLAAQTERINQQRAALEALDKYSKADGRQTKGQMRAEETQKAIDKNAELLQSINQITDADVKAKALAQARAALETEIANINEKHKDKAVDGAKAQQTAYDNLIASIKTKIAQNEQELASGEKLNAAEQLRAQLAGKTEAGTQKLTAAERANAEALLARLDASERLVKVQQEQKKFEDQRDKENARIADDIGKINQRAQALEDEADAYGKTATELRDLAIARLEEKKASVSGMENAQQRIDQINDEIAALRRLGAAEAGLADKKLGAKSGELLEQSREQARLYEDESRLIGLSAVERAKVVALRKVELDYSKRIQEINKSGATDEAKEAARIKALEKKQVDSQAAVSEIVQQDWNKTSQLIGDTLADYIMGGGKDAAQYLKRLFATLVLQPLVQFGVSGVLGAFGLGGGGGGGSGVLGMAQNAYSAYNTGSQLYTIGGQYLGGSMSGANAAGTLWANSTGGGLDGLLATNGAYGTSTGGAGAGASMFSGGGGSLAGFGAFAAVAALALNALGAFRSERIAGNGLTGTLGNGKDLQPYALWREGGTLFDGPRYSTTSPGEEIARYEQEIKELREQGKGGTETVAGLEEQLQYLKDTYGEQIAAAKKQSDAIQATYDAMRTSVGDMADVLGISSDAVRKFTVAVGTDLIHPDTGGYGLDFSGLSQEEIIAKVDEALRTANNTLAEQVIGTWKTVTEEVRRTVVVSPTQWGDNYESAVYREDVETVTRQEYVQSEFARDGEKAIDTLTRLATSLTTVNSVFENLGTTLYASSLAGGDMASMLLDLFGGAENFGAATGTYFQNFFSPEEQRKAMQEQLQKQLDTLDLQLPDINAVDARAQYRALAEAQDLTTEAGRKAYAMLIQLAGSFASVTTAAEDMRERVASQRLSLEERLLKAGGDDRGALDMRRKQEYDALYKLDPALAHLVAQIYALEDASAIASKRFDVEQRLLIAQGKEREALDLRRGQEYDALYKLDPALANMIAQVWALEDAAQAVADKETARNNAMRDLSDAMGRQTEIWENQLSAIDTQRQLQQEALGLITGIFDLVRSNARDLYGEVQSTAAMQATQGSAFIAQALATAKRTGYLPEQDALQQAISGARSGLDNNNFASQVDADFARLVLAGQLKGLEEIAGPQKTAAEQQLDRLDAQTDALNKQIREQQKQYDLIQRQIDIENGTYNATITVAEATAKIIELLGGKAPAGVGSGAVDNGGAAWGGSAAGGGASAPSAKYSRMFWIGTGAGYEGITDQSVIERLDKLASVYHAFDGTGDLVGLGTAFKGAGGTISDLSILSGNWEADWRKAFASVGVPAFAVGTNYVPYDTPAIVHKGERIIPAADNRALMAAVNGGGQRSEMAAVVAELREVKAQLAAVRAAAESSASSNAQLAEQTDSVTEGGNGTRVEIMNVSALAKALAEEMAA